MTLRQQIAVVRARLRETVRKRHDAKPGGDRRRKLARLVRELRERLERLLARLRHRWPREGSFTELLYHSPPHLHAASADRDFLVRIARIGEKRYGLRIGEFPPFDTVEAVHVSGSWHYRDSSNPWTPRTFAGRGDGLAFDANDADGGSDREVAFYNELRRRYG